MYEFQIKKMKQIKKGGLTHVGVIERMLYDEPYILLDGYSHAKTLRGVKSDVIATLEQYSPSEAYGVRESDGDSWLIPKSIYGDAEPDSYFAEAEEIREGLWYVHMFCAVH